MWITPIQIQNYAWLHKLSQVTQTDSKHETKPITVQKTILNVKNRKNPILIRFGYYKCRNDIQLKIDESIIFQVFNSAEKFFVNKNIIQTLDGKMKILLQHCSFVSLAVCNQRQGEHKDLKQPTISGIYRNTVAQLIYFTLYILSYIIKTIKTFHNACNPILLAPQ